MSFPQSLKRRLRREETTDQRTLRLKAEDRWVAFGEERERLELAGHSKEEAYFMAAEKFRPAVQDVEDLEEPEEEKEPEAVGEARASPVEEPPEADADEGKVVKVSPKKDVWRIRAEWFSGKKGSNPLQDILWVANQIGLDEVDLRDAPSPAAAYMLKKCKTDETFEASFWSDFYVKVVPGRAAVEDAFKSSVDDGLDRVERNNEIRAISERFQGEEKEVMAEVLGHEM